MKIARLRRPFESHVIIDRLSRYYLYFLSANSAMFMSMLQHAGQKKLQESYNEKLPQGTGCSVYYNLHLF